MNHRTRHTLSVLLLFSSVWTPTPSVKAQEQEQSEHSQTSWHHLLSQALVDLHQLISQGYAVPERLAELIHTIKQASLEDIVQGLLVSIEILQQDEQLPEPLKEECTRTAQLIAELQSAMDITNEPTRGGIFKEIPSLLVGVLRVVNALRVSGTLYLNPPAGTTALRVNGDSIFNGTTEFFGDVTITGTTTAETIIATDLSLTPSPAPQPTTDGQIFVSNGSAPAPNAGDLYYVLPLAQGGGVINLVASSGSGTVTQLNSGNGIVLTPDPITTTGTIATNATSANTPNTIISRDGSGNFAAGTASLENLELPNTTTTVGQITKNSVLFIHNFGSNNTFTGVNSGNLTLTTAQQNTGNGVGTLFSLTSGNDNTALGYAALAQTTTGRENTAVGSAALLSNITGERSTAVGAGALQFNVADNNTAVGAAALQQNDTGTRNTAVGGFASQQNTTGTDNTAIGYQALTTNTTGSSNTAVGSDALNSNTIGTLNTAVGTSSMEDNSTGQFNTSLGALSLRRNTTAVNNTAVGYSALLNNTTGSQNTAVGSNALTANVTGTNIVAVGYNALFSNTANNNTAVGSLSLDANTTGLNNTAVGAFSLTTNVTGSGNTAVGTAALENNLGSSNTAIGLSALNQNTTGSNNTAVGQSALGANTTGVSNVGVGLLALSSNTAGIENVAIGVEAAGNNVSGDANIAIGRSALQANTTGGSNVAIGNLSLSGNTAGSDNTVVGSRAIESLTSGSGNIVLGRLAGSAYTSTESNNIIISNAGIVGESGVIRIGTNLTHTTCYIQGISGVTTGGAAAAVLVDANGQLGTISSSRRYKDNIKSLDASVADTILKLNPVEFNYKSKTAIEKEFGLIAEEVAEIMPELVIHNKDGQVETVRYHILPVILLQALKKQNAMIIEQQQIINAQEQRLARLEERIK